MIYGSCLVGNEERLVTLVEDKNGKSIYVRLCSDNGIPISKPIKRHKVKHHFVLHGENIIRHDLIERR